MYTYLNKNIPGRMFRPEEPLTEDNCLLLGQGADDYEKGLYIPLTKDQTAFAEVHPDADVEEILKAKIDPSAALDRARSSKLIELAAYDCSGEVNSFLINGVSQWFTPAQRANYKQSVESSKLLGVGSLHFFAGDTLLSVLTAEADRMLAMIQLYADECYITTKKHQTAIGALKTAEEVEAYDITIGYPEKLSFHV
ncbi:MAG: DUF4376 domain-containing protein [Muribaculaceae bacterium]|nr:DUF4376 domain-containing protein [Muribaculaceae bacterium]